MVQKVLSKELELVLQSVILCLISNPALFSFFPLLVEMAHNTWQIELMAGIVNGSN